MTVSFLHALPPVPCYADVTSMNDGAHFVNEKESVTSQASNNSVDRPLGQEVSSLPSNPPLRVDRCASRQTWNDNVENHDKDMFKSFWGMFTAFLSIDFQMAFAKGLSTPKCSVHGTPLVTDSHLGIASASHVSHPTATGVCLCPTRSVAAFSEVDRRNTCDREGAAVEAKPATRRARFCLGRPALQTPPLWTRTHCYVRDNRANSAELRMLSAERAMIMESKLTRPLKNRRSLDKRSDDFVWGRPSCLRIGCVGQ